MPAPLFIVNQNCVNLETDQGCTFTANVPSSAVMADNTTKLNYALAGRDRNGVLTGQGYEHAIVIPRKRLYTNGPIVFPQKTNCYLIGEGGQSFRLGNNDYSPGGQGGPESQIVNIGGGSIVQVKGYGGGIFNVVLQGRDIPGNSLSATGTPAAIGVDIFGGTAPSTQKFTLDHCTFIECAICIHTNATVTENHADTLTVNNCTAQGFDTFFKSDNQQSISNAFRDITWLGNANCILFDCVRGGMPFVENCEIDCQVVTVLKLHEFSPFNNSFVFRGLRYDSPSPALSGAGILKLVDFSAAANYVWHIRFEDLLICAYGGIGFDYDPALLVGTPGGVRDYDLSINFVGPRFGPIPPQMTKYQPLGPIQSLSTITPHSLDPSDTRYNDGWWLNGGVVTKAP